VSTLPPVIASSLHPGGVRAPFPICVAARMLLIFLGGLALPAASWEEPALQVRDDVGRQIQIKAPVHRLVSLAPSVTETLFDLGAGHRLVGVTDLCDYPPAARQLPRVGGMVKPDWESVVRLHPDLVVATTAGNDASLVGQAEKVGLPIYFTDAPDLEGLLNSMVRLGDAIGSGEKGRQLRKDVESRIRRIEQTPLGARPPRVLFLVWVDPPVVPGSGTFLSDALRRAGIDSVTSDAPPGWPTYDLETLLLRRPEWIVSARQNAAALAGLTQRPGWRDLEAVSEKRVGTVSETIERPSPRVVDAMEELRSLLRRGAAK
jgi:ABC-type Fe3+-hydroxamate transport system substrate-binding protein